MRHSLVQVQRHRPASVIVACSCAGAPQLCGLGGHARPARHMCRRQRVQHTLLGGVVGLTASAARATAWAMVRESVSMGQLKATYGSK